MKWPPGSGTTGSLTRREFLGLGALGVGALLGATVAGCQEAVLDSLAPPESWDYAFVQVQVVPMDVDALLSDQTVVTANGRIVAMGPSSAITLPAHVRQIDGRGRYLMPGLADMHVHLAGPFGAYGIRDPLNPETIAMAEDDLLLYAANGVTTIRNMFGIPFHAGLKRRIVDEDLLAPTLYTSGPRIATGSWHPSLVLATPEEADREVRAQRLAGYDFVKVGSESPVEIYDAIMNTAAEIGIPVIGHVNWRVGVAGVIAAGQSSIEHLDGYLYAARANERATIGADRPCLWADRADTAKIDGLVAQTAAAGAWNCPTLSTNNRPLAQSDVDAFARRFEVSLVPPDTRSAWAHLTGSIPDRNPQQERCYALHQSIVRALSDADAPLLVGTDGWGYFMIPGFAIHEELWSFVDAGLTPFQALRAATSESGRYLREALGIDEVVGVVRLGAQADLLLLNSNPLIDVANVADRAGVMLRGRWVPETEIADRLDALAAAYDAQEAA
ncbi:MAG: amidohydrolase family protein [Chloroflexi bacterium]|nr:amidohydrolase family protein [Chloroflexota bacterium]